MMNPEVSHLLDAITPDVDPETVPEPAGTVPSGFVLFACIVAFAALVWLAFRAAGVIQ